MDDAGPPVEVFSILLFFHGNFAMFQDLFHNLAVVQAIKPQVATATVLSDAVAIGDYEGALIVANVGASGDTLSGTVYLEIEVQESDDDSTYTAAANASIIGSTVTGHATGTIAKIDAAAEDECRVICGYKGTAKYLKINVRLTGSHTNGIPIAASVILSGNVTLPVNS